MIAVIAPRIADRPFRRIERAFHALARRKKLAVLTVGLLTLAVRAALLPLLPVPVPGVHDEYSYLLQADTFAHGRVANPTPPLWTHFDTFHEIFQPSYASKYPPLQSLILAFGQVVFGHPWLGVWLSVGVMCAAICWMLQGWLPPGWALLGGLIALIRLGTFSYWMNSYWGGAAAAIGGAFVLGALPRIIRKRQFMYAWLMGIGIAMLANSRPYEGALLVLPTALILLVWMLRNKRTPATVLIARVIVPLAACLLITATAMGYYNWRLTGNPALLPYEVHMSQYEISPLFLWGKIKTHIPIYHAPEIREYHVSVETAPYRESRSLRGAIREAYLKIKLYDFFFLGPILNLPVIALPWVLRDRRVRPLVWIGLVTFVGLLLTTWSMPHYAAPGTALIYAFILQSLRHIRLWTFRRKPTGLFLVRAVPVICLILLGVRTAIPKSYSVWAWYANWPGNLERAQLLDELRKMPERQLVIVRYSPDHSVHREWVFNRADIPDAHVIWAHDDTEAANEQLIKRFAGRRVWLLEPDGNPPKLMPYSSYSVVATTPAKPSLHLTHVTN